VWGEPPAPPTHPEKVLKWGEATDSAREDEEDPPPPSPSPLLHRGWEVRREGTRGALSL